MTGREPMTPREVRRVVLAGAGMISRHHLLAWRKAGIEVVALADPDRDRAAERAREFGVARVYPSLAAALASETVDAVDIASPRETHANLVRLAADRSVDALCQKPLAPTLGEAQQLAADVANRIRVMVHENWRFRWAYRRIRRWIDETEPGTFLQGRLTVQGAGLLADANGRYPSLERQPFFRTEQRLLIAETLTHHIDVARWLIGPLRLIAARALHTSDVVIGETTATLLLETEAGAPITIEGSLTVPGGRGPSNDDLVLVFQRGTVRFRDNRLAFEGRCEDLVVFDRDAAYQASFDAAIAHFVDALRAGHPFETDMGDNLETLRIVEEAYDLIAEAERERTASNRPGRT